MSLKISAEQKALESRRNVLQARRKILNEEIEAKKSESTFMKNQIDRLQKEIEDLKSKTPSKLVVSEHALLRYISRVLGIDLGTIADKILTDEVKEVAQKLGSCKVKSPDGFKVVIKDRVVVTVE